MNRCKNCKEFKEKVDATNVFCFFCANEFIHFIQLSHSFGIRLHGEQLIKAFIERTEAKREIEEDNRFMRDVEEQMQKTYNRFKQRFLELTFEVVFKD